MERLQIDCHPKIAEWLDTIIDVQEEFNGMIKQPRWERLAYLVICNGGWATGQYGIIAYYGNSPFKDGLNHLESSELDFHRIYLQGMAYMAEDKEIFNKLSEMINFYSKEKGVEISKEEMA